MPFFNFHFFCFTFVFFNRNYHVAMLLGILGEGGVVSLFVQSMILEDFTRVHPKMSNTQNIHIKYFHFARCPRASLLQLLSTLCSDKMHGRGLL